MRVVKNSLRHRFGRASSTFMRSLSSTSVNPEEIRKFGAVGADWWDKDSKKGTGPLHAMNPTRVEFIRTRAAAHLRRDKEGVLDQIRGVDVLDVGCGGGLLAESLARLGANVVAIDPAEENVQVARMHSEADESTRGILYENTTVEHMAASGRSFDLVCSLEVIEHVENPLSFIESCAACLRPGGSLFLSTLNRSPKSYLFAILGAEHITGMIPVGTHDWNKFITPTEMRKMVSSVASVEEMSGIVFTPEIRGASPSLMEKWKISATDLDVNYILHAVKNE